MRLPVLLVLCALVGGCSQALDWQAIQACDAMRCREGYSCMTFGPTQGCVADQSFRLSDSCLTSQQCEAGLECIARSCRKPCQGDGPRVYAEAACADGEVCRPLGAGFGEAACEPSDPCLAGAACMAPNASRGGVCVAISRLAKACLPSCEPQQADCAAGSSCQAVGLAPDRATVCVPTTSVND